MQHNDLEYRKKVSERVEWLKNNPEMLDRIQFYAQCAANGDAKAGELLNVLDETGYLRIACIEITSHVK